MWSQRDRYAAESSPRDLAGGPWDCSLLDIQGRKQGEVEETLEGSPRNRTSAPVNGTVMRRDITMERLNRLIETMMSNTPMVMFVGMVVAGILLKDQSTAASEAAQCGRHRLLRGSPNRDSDAAVKRSAGSAADRGVRPLFLQPPSSPLGLFESLLRC